MREPGLAQYERQGEEICTRVSGPKVVQKFAAEDTNKIVNHVPSAFRDGSGLLSSLRVHEEGSHVGDDSCRRRARKGLKSEYPYRMLNTEKKTFVGRGRSTLVGSTTFSLGRRRTTSATRRLAVKNEERGKFITLPLCAFDAEYVTVDTRIRWGLQM